MESDVSKASVLTTAALVAAAALTGISGSAHAARDQIRIVGSSTVYPFATVVAEEFGRSTKYKTPIIESTGSGGGLKLFCQGVGPDYPDITNASRRIKMSEVKNCAANGIDAITEVKIGYDGIVVANSVDGPKFNLTLRELYLALAKEVPVDGKIVPNPYKNWSEVNPDLPNEPIEVLGPPPTSGTRDAFDELALEGGCVSFPEVMAVKEQDEDRFLQICRGIREDGAYIEAGENDNLIVQKLVRNHEALGIFGYSFLEQNADVIQGSSIGGVEPTFDNIASGDYPVSRSLYFYVKNAHVGSIPGIKEYLAEFTSDRAWGDFGYLAEKGLIPMPEEEREKYQAAAEKLTPLHLEADE